METYISNIIPILQQWWSIIFILAYLMGVIFAVSAPFQVISHKNRYNKAPALWSFVCAVLLLNLSTFMDSLSLTIFNTTSEQGLSYSPPESPGSVYIQFAVYSIMLIGAIGIVRGVYLWRDTPNQPMNFPRGLVHLIGGIFAVNLVDFLSGIGATIGGDVQTYIANII